MTGTARVYAACLRDCKSMTQCHVAGCKRPLLVLACDMRHMLHDTRSAVLAIKHTRYPYCNNTQLTTSQSTARCQPFRPSRPSRKCSVRTMMMQAHWLEAFDCRHRIHRCMPLAGTAVQP